GGVGARWQLLTDFLGTTWGGGNFGGVSQVIYTQLRQVTFKTGHFVKASCQLASGVGDGFSNPSPHG
ncbi:hypothetical protein, partial [Corynebacterium heidelbergense]|uniref:hypothetical protein n=1 Tax=Corynebacterium heidelbergense TaxID=2055947 RepID=UPI001EE72BED